MSGISGIVNLNHDIMHELENLNKMVEKIRHRGNRKIKISNFNNCLLACSNFYEYSDEQTYMPITVKLDEVEYSLVFDGEIYNCQEIKKELSVKGLNSEKHSQAEIVLKSYIKWGAGCLEKLNGIFAFAIWNKNNNEFFMARDRFGIKPLYYSITNDCLFFASEVKSLLAHPSIKPVIGENEILEVLGLGPAHSQGISFFENIHEVLPSHCVVYNKNGFNSYAYWELNSTIHSDDFETTVEKVRELTISAINRQIESKGKDVCCFLSGGLDSSSIVSIAAKKYGSKLKTFSLEYDGNSDHFKPNEYQPSSDEYYINLMTEKYNIKHEVITVSNQELIENLSKSVIARDAPGMGDVDSSLYYFCNKVKNEFEIAISGECADEIFGGYPWFHRKEDFDSNIFPWSKNIEFRESLINKDLSKKLNVKDYIYKKYNDSISCTPRLAQENNEEKRRREISYLNQNWFMYTLGERSERIGMNNGLEIRMPYCDYNIAEYLWNVPWSYKSFNNREKGLLRKALEGILPEEVLWRKKCPYPKTHNPEYENLAKEMVMDILNDNSSKVHSLINKDFVYELMKMQSDYSKPWFGQLMATPQLYSYIIQLEFWLEHYNISVNI